MIALLWLTSILKAHLLRRPLALCDIGDLDGIACAALFKIRFPEGVVVLASPADVRRSWLLRRVSWTFVGDLPCPGRVLVRADHHASNAPCALQEFYDPSAPASAVLAARALDLCNDERAKKLVDLAVETDTANITSPEALELNDAVKGSSYRGKLRLIELLATSSLERVLSDPEVRAAIERYRGVRRATEELSERLPPREFFVALFERDLGLSYRYLCILMERRGSKVTIVVVPKGLATVRVYLGSSSRDHDVSRLATRLGGGGHPYAAGATVRGLRRSRVIEGILREASNFLGLSELSVIVVKEGGIEERRWPW